MKTINRIIIVIVLLISVKVNAQFEQKLTLNISSGVTNPTGQSDYYTWNEHGYSVDKPFLFGNFSAGALLNVGLQYNMSRNLGFGAKLRPLYLFGWDYYDEFGNNWGDNIIMTLFNMGIGVNAKYKFFPAKKLNPFVFMEVSGNYTSVDFMYFLWGEHFSKNYASRTPFLESSFGMGYSPAIGVDYNLNDKWGMFLQGGYNTVFIKDKNYNPIYYDGTFETQNFTTFYLEIGVIISFIKSDNL